VELVLDGPVASDPGGKDIRAGVTVAGDQLDDLDGFLSVPRDRIIPSI
jgi:hypothetical protein